MYISIFVWRLFSMASCLSAQWTSQVAWTWFWDNLERMLKNQLGQLKGLEDELWISLYSCDVIYCNMKLPESPGFNWIKVRSGTDEESCQDSSALWTGSSGTYRRRASPDCAGMYTNVSLSKLQAGRTILSSRPHDCTSSQARRESLGILWCAVFWPVWSTATSCLPVLSHVTKYIFLCNLFICSFQSRPYCLRRCRHVMIGP